eukprot:Nk52_evm22s2391 gene=Nk52_evmTU22s2391
MFNEGFSKDIIPPLVVVTYWVIGILGMSALFASHYLINSLNLVAPPFLRDIASYGKIKQSLIQSKVVNTKGWLFRSFNVRKSLFLYFYLTGVVFLSLLIPALISDCSFVGYLTLPERAQREAEWHKGNIVLGIPFWDGIAVLILFLVQDSRRLFECCFVSIFSKNAQMHFAHFLVGISFYVLTPMTVVLAMHRRSSDLYSSGAGDQDYEYSSYLWGMGRKLLNAFYCHSGDDGDVQSCESFSALKIFAVVGFLYAQVIQYRSHCELALLRKDDKKTSSSSYHLPTKGMFMLVDCPHYTAEILIYTMIPLLFTAGGGWFSFWGDGSPNVDQLYVYICHTIGIFMIPIFVFANLSFTALETHRWYKEKFREQYPSGRKAIIPLIL